MFRKSLYLSVFLIISACKGGAGGGGGTIDFSGTLDLTFNTTGYVTNSFAGTSQEMNSVAYQTNGNIVTGGYVFVGGVTKFALTRYSSSGGLDGTFGTAGKVITSINANDDVLFGVAIQTDGKVIAVGESYYTGNFHFAVVRYTSAGALDATFNASGVRTDAVGQSDVPYNVIIQQDNKIVSAGYAYNAGVAQFVALRYNTDGSLDSTFAETPGFGRAVVQQSNGEIVLAGESNSQNFQIVRYATGGNLDTNFGTSGVTSVTLSATSSNASALAIQSDQKLLAVGTADISSKVDFAIARFNTDGSLDTGFAGVGYVTTAIGSLADTATGAFVLPDGRIFEAGYSQTSSGYSLAFARLNSNGSLDTSIFGVGYGALDLSSVTPVVYARAASIQADGKMLLSGSFALSGVTTCATVRLLP